MQYIHVEKELLRTRLLKPTAGLLLGQAIVVVHVNYLGT